MRVGLVSNYESRGLQMDARLLSDLLCAFGHEPLAMQYDQPQQEPADLLIFLEVVIPGLVSLSKNPPWLIVNPEFLFQHDFKTIQTLFGKILCKTREAQRICSAAFGEKAIYTGFLAADKFNPAIPREAKFLHVAGASRIKNTQAVIDAWRWKQNGKALDAELTVIADWLEGDARPELPPGVAILNRVSDEQLAELQNSHRFHLQPSGTEGFGHALHEAMSVNATILTTDAAPMNELQSVYLIPATGKSYFNQAEVYEVSAIDIHIAVRELLEIPERFQSPRDEFLRTNDEFKQVFADSLADCQPRKHCAAKFDREFDGQLRIAFLGNFKHSFCTESDLAWTFEHLGHEVIRVQEDMATVAELESAAIDADMFLWVHTHGWQSVSDVEMFQFLDRLRVREIPSVFFHLDRYWGIPEREEAIGVDPCWECKYVFTADGGNQEKFWAKSVNHFWLPPAVVERGVHYGFRRTDLRCDVGFVGATHGYHPCYPFRGELIAFLRDRYRIRFKDFNGVREASLNDVYASTSVVVGDCIFSGAPNYWSDRLPETAGRGGFIIYPRCDGLSIPTPTYKAQDLGDLAKQIDYWLAHPVERRNVQKASMEHVRLHDTYTNRVQQIIKVVFDAK